MQTLATKTYSKNRLASNQFQRIVFVYAYNIRYNSGVRLVQAEMMVQRGNQSA